MAAPPPKLSPKSHKWACTQAKIMQPHFLLAEVTWAVLGRVYSFASGFLERAAFIIPAGLSVGIKIYTERELQCLKLHSFSCNIDMTAGASSRAVHWQTKQLLIPTWGVVTQPGVIWVVEAGFWARTRDTREHFRFSLLTHVSNFTLAPPNSPQGSDTDLTKPRWERQKRKRFRTCLHGNACPLRWSSGLSI